MKPPQQANKPSVSWGEYTKVPAQRQRYGLLGIAAIVGAIALICQFSRSLPHEHSAPSSSSLAAALRPEPEETDHWLTVPASLFTSSDDTPSPTLPSPMSRTLLSSPSAPLWNDPLATNPLAGYTYTGTVNVNGVLTALIEERASKQGWYVQAGETWQTYQVGGVTPQGVTMLIAGKSYWLPKSDVINLVPFDNPARRGMPEPAAGETGTGAAQELADALSADALGDTALADAGDMDTEVAQGRGGGEAVQTLFEATIRLQGNVETDSANLLITRIPVQINVEVGVDAEEIHRSVRL